MRTDPGALAREPCGAAMMEALVGPPWIEVAVGGCGIAIALWSIGRRMDGKPMHPDAKMADVGLLVFGCLLAVAGLVRLVF